MNDICRDTALVRMSDAAGFEGEDQKKRHDTRWLDEIVDEGDILVSGGITARNFGHAVRRFIHAVHDQLRGVHREFMV